MSDDKKEPLVNVDRTKYHKTKAASGAASLNNGDDVATALEGLNDEEVFAVADKLIPDNDFAKRYAKLNPGMRRMNVGNRLRGFVRKDEKNAAAFARVIKPIAAAAAKRAKAEAAEKAAAAKARAEAAAAKKAAKKAPAKKTAKKKAA